MGKEKKVKLGKGKKGGIGKKEKKNEIGKRENTKKNFQGGRKGKIQKRFFKVEERNDGERV